jgi:hypothetical protein
VPITSLQCDGDTNKCVAGLVGTCVLWIVCLSDGSSMQSFGDGKWAAQWAVSILHNTRAVRSSDGELVGRTTYSSCSKI